MEHSFGITLSFAFRYKDKIENIADNISNKYLIRKYFGNAPFLTPDKKVFVLKKENNEFIMSSNEGPINSNIGVTVRYQYTQDTRDTALAEVSQLLKECCDILCAELNITVLRIGSMYPLVSTVSDGYKILREQLTQDILNDKESYSGGQYKFLYRRIPEEIGKELNININVVCEDLKNIINFLIDINNKDMSGTVTTDDIIKIGIYSNKFVFGEFKAILTKKGIALNEQ